MVGHDPFKNPATDRIPTFIVPLIIRTHDAFQRANFWKVLGNRASRYHVLLDPIRTLDPILIDVPPNEGLALTNGLVLGPPAFCAPQSLVDANWFDSYVNGTILPEGAPSTGVNGWFSNNGTFTADAGHICP